MSEGLTPESTLDELFEHIRVDEGMNVIPITLKQDPKDTRLMIVIQGNANMAGVMFAQLITAIQDMSDLVEQQEIKDDESRIVLPGS